MNKSNLIALKRNLKIFSRNSEIKSLSPNNENKAIMMSQRHPFANRYKFNNPLRISSNNNNKKGRK